MSTIKANTFTAQTTNGDVTIQGNGTGYVKFGQYAEKTNDLGSVSGAVDIDLRDGNTVILTITGDTTFTFSNPAGAGYSSGFSMYITNGGAWNITYPASAKFAGNVEPPLSVAGEDLVVFSTYNSGTKWIGSLALLDIS